jgi:uncharacterized protein (DUF362 family)
MKVFISKRLSYDADTIFSALPDAAFEAVTEARSVILKPNWVSETHRSKPGEWDYVITHPAVITAVLQKVIQTGQRLERITITDGPQTDSSFSSILTLNPVAEWERMARQKGISLEIIDLRDDEWISQQGVVVERRSLPGDPRGKCLFNLPGDKSEFHGQPKSTRGYYGADYNIAEVNESHNGIQNLYSVSRSVIEGDVFINLPKLKTHKKAGITCCLKNLVGINTYKNYLPHHMEGDPTTGGDQFPSRNVNAVIEGPLLATLKQSLLANQRMAKLLSPLKKTGEKIFGKTGNTIRSGNWYGNDTLWRTILDLNKILLYGNPDGSFRHPGLPYRKPYIAVVDGILAGQGNGPLEPDPVEYGRIITGTGPAEVDLTCAWLMGFEPWKIPSIARAFNTHEFPVAMVPPEQVTAVFDGANFALSSLPAEFIHPFIPHFGWKGHIERL